MRKQRLFWLLGFGLFLVTAAFAYVHYFLLLPLGSGPAGPQVPAAPFQSVWTEREIVLVGLGDSVTAGFGARPGYSYFDLLAENSPDDFGEMRGRTLSAVFPNLTKLNLARSGSNSLDHQRLVLEKLETQPADRFGIVVITTGGNDLIHWYGRSKPKEGAMYGASHEEAAPWIANFAERLDGMLTEIHQRFPGGCEIFLSDIYDPSDNQGRPQSAGLPPWPDLLPILAAYNDVIHSAASKHAWVHLVSTRELFLGHGVHCRQPWGAYYRSTDPYYWYAANIEDPNERGYDALRRAFLLKIIAARERF